MAESVLAVVPLFGLVTLLFAAGATLLHTTLVALGGGGRDEDAENTRDAENDTLATSIATSNSAAYGSTDRSRAASVNGDGNRQGNGCGISRQYSVRGRSRLDADSSNRTLGDGAGDSDHEGSGDGDEETNDASVRSLAADTRSRVLAAAAALELGYSCASRAEEAEENARAHADAVETLWAKPHPAFDDFVTYVERRGVVSLSLLTKCFMLESDDVAAVLRGLCACGKLHGYLDERGNFVCTERPPKLDPLTLSSTGRASDKGGKNSTYGTNGTSTTATTASRGVPKRPRPPLMTS